MRVKNSAKVQWLCGKEILGVEFYIKLHKVEWESC